MEIINECKPFFIKGGKVGCLLVHGFTGCPYEMKDLGHYLGDRGFTVSGVRLPGHGTVPEDLARVSWQDWVEEVQSGFKELKEKCEQVYVVGLSMGGALCLDLASHEQVSGVVTLAAPVFLSDFRLKFLPLLKYFKKWTGVIGDDVKKEVKTICYHRVSTLGVWNLVQLLRRVKSGLGRVSAPILILQARQDHTVPPQNAPYIYAHVCSIDKELVWMENSFHVITLDQDKDRVFTLVVDFIKRFSTLAGR